MYVTNLLVAVILIHCGASDVEGPTHPASYDLIANVTLESVAGTTRDKENTAWRVHLRAADGDKWYQIHDLVVEETRKEMIFLGETVLQVRNSN